MNASQIYFKRTILAFIIYSQFGSNKKWCREVTHHRGVARALTSHFGFELQQKHIIVPNLIVEQNPANNIRISHWQSWY